MDIHGADGSSLPGVAGVKPVTSQRTQPLPATPPDTYFGSSPSIPNSAFEVGNAENTWATLGRAINTNPQLGTDALAPHEASLRNAVATLMHNKNRTQEEEEALRFGQFVLYNLKEGTGFNARFGPEEAFRLDPNTEKITGSTFFRLFRASGAPLNQDTLNTFNAKYEGNLKLPPNDYLHDIRPAIFKLTSIEQDLPGIMQRLDERIKPPPLSDIDVPPTEYPLEDGSLVSRTSKGNYKFEIQQPQGKKLNLWLDPEGNIRFQFGHSGVNQSTWPHMTEGERIPLKEAQGKLIKFLSQHFPKA